MSSRRVRTNIPRKHKQFTGADNFYMAATRRSIIRVNLLVWMVAALVVATSLAMIGIYIRFFGGES